MKNAAPHKKAVLQYSVVWKKSPAKKKQILENPQNGRSARRTPVLGIFPDFLEFSGFVFPYNTVRQVLLVVKAVVIVVLCQRVLPSESIGVSGFAANFVCGFLEFWKAGASPLLV